MSLLQFKKTKRASSDGTTAQCSLILERPSELWIPSKNS